MAGECKAIPYEGDAPFVFISYSHKNMKAAKEIIDGLGDIGYRVWYDRGAIVGNSWLEEIPEHLLKSEVCIALLSEEFERSKRCMNEFNMTNTDNINLIPIFLSGYEPSKKIVFELGYTKVIKWHDYSSSHELIRELSRNKYIGKCISDPPKPLPEQPPETSPPSSFLKWPFAIMAVFFVAILIGIGILRDPGNSEDHSSEISPHDTIASQSSNGLFISETSTPFPATTKDTYTYIEDGGISYQLDNGTATVLAYSGSNSDVLIPSRVGGSEVTSISDGAFSENSSIESVTLPATIEYIGSRAFNGCNNLQVLYSASLEPVTVEPSAFTNCPKLIAIQSGCSETAWNQPEKCKVFVTGSTTGSGLLVEILLDDNGVIYGRTEEDEAVVLYISELFPADERYVIPNEIEFPDGSSLPVTYIEDTSITSKTKVNGIQLASDVLFSLKFAEQLQDWDIGYYYGYGKLSQCWLFSCFSSLMLENKRPSSVPDILPNVELTERAMDLARDVHMNPDSFEFDTWFEADNGETHYIITGSLQDVYDYLRYNTTLLTGSDCGDYTEIGVGCYYAGGGAAPRSCIIVRTAE